MFPRLCVGFKVLVDRQAFVVYTELNLSRVLYEKKCCIEVDLSFKTVRWPLCCASFLFVSFRVIPFCFVSFHSILFCFVPVLFGFVI